MALAIVVGSIVQTPYLDHPKGIRMPQDWLKTMVLHKKAPADDPPCWTSWPGGVTSQTWKDSFKQWSLLRQASDENVARVNIF